MFTVAVELEFVGHKADMDVFTGVSLSLSLTSDSYSFLQYNPTEASEPKLNVETTFA